jgi:hypothetical protein
MSVFFPFQFSMLFFIHRLIFRRTSSTTAVRIRGVVAIVNLFTTSCRVCTLPMSDRIGSLTTIQNCSSFNHLGVVGSTFSKLPIFRYTTVFNFLG